MRQNYNNKRYTKQHSIKSRINGHNNINQCEKYYSQPQEQHKLFIGGIPPDTNKRELGCFFSQFGQLSDIFLPMNKKRKCLKGFAFVSYRSKQAYNNVLKIKEHTLRGKIMIARAALKENDASHISKILQSQKLYARGFPLDTTEARIEEFFNVFGPVNRVLMCFDKYRKFRGFAYVIMDSKKGFENVLEVAEQTAGNSLKFEGHNVYISSSKTQKELTDLRREQENTLKMFVKGDVEENGLEQQENGVCYQTSPAATLEFRGSPYRNDYKNKNSDKRRGGDYSEQTSTKNSNNKRRRASLLKASNLQYSPLFSHEGEESHKLLSSRIPDLLPKKAKSQNGDIQKSKGYSILGKYCSKGFKNWRKRNHSGNINQSDRNGTELIRQHNLLFKNGAGSSYNHHQQTTLSLSQQLSNSNCSYNGRSINSNDSYYGDSPLLGALSQSPSYHHSNGSTTLNNSINKNYCLRLQNQVSRN